MAGLHSPCCDTSPARHGGPRSQRPQPHQRRQRGSVVVTSMIALSLLVLALVGTELGYLFALKRDFQKSADLAALAGAQALRPGDCAAAQNAAVANAARNLPAGYTLAAGDVTCGHWDPVKHVAAPHFAAPGVDEGFNAVRVAITRTPELLLPQLPGNAQRTVAVEAYAAQRAPRAMLNIRSALVTLDSSKSALLNAVLGGLLGGSLNLSLADWNGLVNSDVNLLGFLDQLAVKLNVQAGHYDEVLNAQASVGTIVDAMVAALQAGGNTATVAIAALNQIKAGADLASAQPLLRLGDLLGVQTGTPAAGLDVGIQAFQIVEGLVQLANRQSTVVAAVPVTIPGIGGATVNLKVGEAPRVSAIGDPELAALDPLGVNKIAVQTAQLRALVSVDLPGLNGVAGLLNAVTQLLTPVTTLLNNVLSLNLQTILSSVLCLPCTQTQIVLAPETPWKVSVYLDAPSSKAHITDVDCDANGSNALEVQTQTSVSSLRIGLITAADGAAALAGGGAPNVTAMPLMDTQTRSCATALLCAPWTTYSRTGLSAAADLVASSATKVYNNPPALDAAQPAYQNSSADSIVASLANALTGLRLQTFKYSATAANKFGDLIGDANALVSAALGAVKGVINLLLAPVLDQLVNTLLNSLGIQLASADIGARLSCTRGAELVY